MSLGIGARRAFHEAASQGDHRLRFFAGVDSVRAPAKDWLRKRMLAASVVQPPVTGVALKMLVQAVQARSQPAQHTLIAPASRRKSSSSGKSSAGH